MTPPAAPDWILSVVGPVTDAARIRWGFTNESWAVTSAEGRRLVVTRLVDPRAASHLLEHAPAVADRLAAAGLPTPVPIADLSDAGRSVVTSAFLDGVPGVEAMAGAPGAALVGRVLGGAWLALERVDPDGLDLDDRWSRPADLTSDALRRLDAVAGELDGEVPARTRARVSCLPSLLANQPTGFVHGDLVPANVLLAGGTLAALLDLEAVRLGPRLLDAAWFRWIVRHHHLALEPSAWAGFVAASGLGVGDPTIMTLLDILPIVRILEILAESQLSAEARGRWQEQLRAAAEALPS